MKCLRLLAAPLICSAISVATAAETPPVLIGLDAAFGQKTGSSAQAIERGIAVAIDEINARGGVLGGRPLVLVTRDNRSVPARSRENVLELAGMADLVAVFTGKLSPVALDILPVIHEQRIPLLDPWASADGIIDKGQSPNFAFRLSLRDSWAIPKMVAHARARGFTKIGMMLPKNGWGRSNALAMEHVIQKQGKNAPALAGIRWHFWGDGTLKEQYRQLAESGAQAIILAANETDAAALIREVAALPDEQRIPLIAHWGFGGGDLRELAGDDLDKVDFSVVQTFTFANNRTPAASRVAELTMRKYGLSSMEEVRSQAGFAHAYDLAHLLAMAIDKAGATDRNAIRDALENLGPYEGLVRRYARPFAPDRHEALSPENLFIGRTSRAGDIHRLD